MKNNDIPTIEEISDLFIPKRFREYLEVTAISPEEIVLKIKKKDAPETKRFVDSFLLTAKITGINIRLI